MGLLTDPSAGQGKLTKAVVKYHTELSVILYVTGICWFLCLAYAPLNTSTYFSENALLPGLVKSEFKDDSTAKQYYNELEDEMKKYDDSIPYPWLLAKFQQIGLDTYTHNFTLNYPLGKLNKYSGKNVYGILRAARAASTEALVMSVPYRPPSNINPPTAPSIAIMLAFAKFANKEKYWSKDIIFLITEHEQLGVQAWLEAYHSVTCGQKDVLDHGDLRGRGGAIQAAINLEFHDINIGNIDIKVEGLNGQLPNLDLFNLATRMCMKEGVVHTFKNKEARSYRDPITDWSYSFQCLMTMVFSQATGVPNGNHGLFHRFGIQALTLEGFPSKRIRRNHASFLTMGRILEGIFRSLNNLLERFHQSYFFYLLPSSERFISIGLYMPVICLLAGALFFKASGIWFELHKTQESSNETDNDKNSELENDKNLEAENDENSEPPEEPNQDIKINKMEEKEIDIIEIGKVLLITHIIGVTIMKSPKYITQFGLEYGLTTELSVYMGFGIFSILLLLAPLFVEFRKCYRSTTVLNVLSLLELATTLICLSMYNISLGLLLSSVYVPLALLIYPKNKWSQSLPLKLLWIIAHPLILVSLTVLIYTIVSFSNESFEENLSRGFIATQQAIMFSVVDSLIYSNWLYNVITAILLPNWVCFWCVLFSTPNSNTYEIDVEDAKKTD